MRMTRMMQKIADFFNGGIIGYLDGNSPVKKGVSSKLIKAYVIGLVNSCADY